MWEMDVTYSESRVGSQLQETFNSWCAQVGSSDVQGGAEVKVAAGCIYLYKTKQKKREIGVTQSAVIRHSAFFWHITSQLPQIKTVWWVIIDHRLCSVARKSEILPLQSEDLHIYVSITTLTGALKSNPTTMIAELLRFLKILISKAV